MIRSLAVIYVAMSLLHTAGAHACSDKLDRALLDESLALGTQFLLANQRAAGNFFYAYDWHNRTDATTDSEVRQAGAAWGLATIYRDTRDEKTRAATLRALRFFAKNARTTASGARFIVYPKSNTGSLGTVALVALAHIELLRVKNDTALRNDLAGYLAFLLEARRDIGGFASRYRHANGERFGAPSPYFDGEALLALVKAAKYLARDDLRQIAIAEAEVGHQKYVKRALAKDPDSNQTKGYYQWSSMAYFELATWNKTKADKRHGDRLLALADWMIDVHKTLRRKRNTAYAYEGIVVAYALAKARGEDDRTAKLGCTIARGLNKLTSWQIGSRIANEHIRSRPTKDRRAIGGVQNHALEPGLRIDVAQHQMHAVILARRHYVGGR